MFTCLAVTTRNLTGKIKHSGPLSAAIRPDTKRAIVKLAAGDKIEMFSSLQ